ncbi:AAA family ATPase [Nocardia higoensis]|uniref:AAA family ATPase n=1 Tax=Nocardia higoensis TaxID=228599 RepID=UPI002B4B1C5B|nr:AAA family ATPase [Nocardia higoensis]
MGWQRSLDTAGAESLAALVAQRIAADPTVSAEVETVVLDALDARLSDAPATGFGATDGVDVAGVFLRAIRVRGFRGIGAQAELELRPGPGLTLVVGRNGSGKSSFAEAAELALTGGNRRWDGRSAEWREGWRNLHDGAGTRIELELLTAGAEPAPLVVKEWDTYAALDEARWSLHHPDGTATDFDVAAWSPILDLYRPFLSYSELGSLVDGRPSDLFDALHQLLGLDELIAAQDRLRTRRLDGERAAKHSRLDRAALIAELDALADDRAARAAAALRADPPDLGTLAGSLRGDADTGDTTALRAILALTIPDPAEVTALADRLTACAATLEERTTTDSEADLRTFDLLRRARHHVAATSACACPVCGQGTLDQDWLAATDRTLTELGARLAAVTAARGDLDAAWQAARALPSPVPAELDPSRAVPPAVDTAALCRAWSRWADIGFAPATGRTPVDRAARATGEEDRHEARPLAAGRPVAAAQSADAPVVTAADARDLAERLRHAHLCLTDELTAVRARARKELERLDSVWSPLAPRLVAWLDDAREVHSHAAELRTLKRAEEWLKALTVRMRDERMAPLQEQSRWIWQTLRQQSNVELGGIRLQGNAGSARRVLLDVTVDQVNGAALGVMSQGELHALGLSLFLPRATVADSPFRFVMIDDPVQAMDPAKVDGLATVLAAVAETRQVVVFTHDERLAEAVRRMDLNAHVLEVQRRERSVVEVRTVGDPVRRYLADARSLLRTPQLPPAIADELVATCCRSAVEAAALARSRRDLLAAGMDHREVERHIENAQTTRAMVALAVMGVTYNVDHLNKHLAREGKWLVDALRDITAAAHVPIGRGMRELIGETERFIAWLRR